MLPVGRLRDWRSNYRRADIIVVTKCPFVLEYTEKQHFINEINPYTHQRIYFSYYNYGKPYPIFTTPSVSSAHEHSFHLEFIDLDLDTDVLLVCAIAKSDYLVEYISSKAKSVTTMEFEDHRLFSNYDVAQFKRLYDNMEGRKKMIITTEKDATRLELHKDYILENRMAMYVIPIEVDFHFNEKETFDKDIKQTLLNFKV